MDCKKSGALIRRLRLGKDMTQSALAELLGVSVQAVSKWERGLGYPDVSLINDLSLILGVDAKGLLCGELSENVCDSGNMNRIKFFVCPECGSIPSRNPKFFCPLSTAADTISTAPSTDCS